MNFYVVVYDDIIGRESGNAANPNGRHFVFKEHIVVPDASEDTLKQALQGVFMNKLNVSSIQNYKYVAGEYFGSSWGVTSLFAHVNICPNDYRCFVINV